jgi:hypothetical protein
VIEAVGPAPERSKGSRAAAVLGVLSVALLGAAFVWAHHWGLLADTLVIAWAVATLGALGVSVHFFRAEYQWATRASHRLVKIGLVGGLVSIAALVLAGVAWAAGINPTGVCGGG